MVSIRSNPIVTLSRLREVLDIDISTGVFCWKVAPAKSIKAGSTAGNLRPDGYVEIKIDYIGYFAHRLMWFHVYEEWPGLLDHKDTIRHHNWLDNLRAATPSQNGANAKLGKHNTSGFKGVHRHRGLWRARIIIGRKSIHVGCYDTPEEAHAAYVAKAKELFGEFANAGT